MIDAIMTEDQLALRDQVRDFVKSVPRQLLLDMDDNKVLFPRYTSSLRQYPQ